MYKHCYYHFRKKVVCIVCMQHSLAIRFLPSSNIDDDVQLREYIFSRSGCRSSVSVNGLVGLEMLSDVFNPINESTKTLN